MTSLSDIPVQLAFEPAKAGSNMVSAVINEIIQLLDVYLDGGGSGAIDIKSLPLSDAEMAHLKQCLGRGEIQATGQFSGSSDIYETAFAGVWWISHRNMDDKIIAEYIEVASVPAILCSHDDDIRQARRRLDDLRDSGSLFESF